MNLVLLSSNVQADIDFIVGVLIAVEPDNPNFISFGFYLSLVLRTSTTRKNRLRKKDKLRFHFLSHCVCVIACKRLNVISRLYRNSFHNIGFT